MSKLKCPFCQQELDTGNYFVHCHDPHCNTTAEMEGTEEMWEALIRAHKALETAVDGLEKMTWGCDSSDAEHLLKEITALEQKNHFADVSKKMEQKDVK